ncbi:MAG: hypothetical protein ACI9FG_000469 [Crocinitomicaceae bacterium]|jgi:hypothetical protein
MCSTVGVNNVNDIDVPLALNGRRRFIGVLGAFAGACMMSIQNAKAGFFYSTKPVAGIPKAWVDQKGTDVLRYANYIKGLRLKNVTPYMVLSPHFRTRGRAKNSLPPRYMWNRIAPTLRVIDAMSSGMRAPVSELLSVYRSPTYNRAVRGRSRSQHLENRAVDVRFKGVSAYTASKVARSIRSKGKFSGGVGRYSSFTHVDTRGHNADW